MTNIYDKQTYMTNRQEMKPCVGTNCMSANQKKLSENKNKGAYYVNVAQLRQTV